MFLQVKKYLHDNKELFNKVAQRQEVWNKFMELERKAKVGWQKCTTSKVHQFIAIEILSDENYMV